MSKPKYVTRSFTVTECKIIACNLADRTTFDEVVEIPGKYKEFRKLYDKIREIYDDDSHVFVSLINAEIKKPIKAIPIDVFLKYSITLEKPLPEDEIAE